LRPLIGHPCRGGDQATANQGRFWWEIALSYYLLRALEALGLVWKLRRPERQTRDAHLRYTDAQRQQLKLESRPGLRVEGPVAGLTPALSQWP
jgi:hypothetical protein